jgi:hypothetical protein
LILADLALILFLVTLAALAGSPASSEAGESTSATVFPEFAPSQALFRPSPGGPSLAQWIASQPRDPRATLTVFAQHTGANSAEIWEEAQTLADSGGLEGVNVRVLITSGGESDIYASLAFDARPADP